MGEIRHTLLMDFETRSSVDIGKCGSFRYMESPDFSPLLLAYAFDDSLVHLVDFAQGETWPRHFLDALDNEEITLLAWNCAFERGVLRQTLGYSAPERWFDVMHLSAHCGLPLSLEKAGEALGLGEDQAKMKEGKALIRYFCNPRKPTMSDPGRRWNDPPHAPEKWALFRSYCIRDVEAERTIYRTLRRWTPDETERRFWALDQKINERGIRCDLTLARNASEIDRQYKAELAERAIAISGIENPNSVSQVKAWLMEQEGLDVPSLNKKEIADVVAKLQTDKAKEFMTIRSELSKTSVKKYDAFLRSACADDHVKGCFQFFGGHTGRFAGRLVQLQNLKSNHLEDLDLARTVAKEGDAAGFELLWPNASGAISELVRTVLIPEEGQRFIVADFSAIEARVSAWLAGEEWVLQSFRDGKDIYCETASQMFKVPVEKHGQNSELRAKGKIAVLACGYGGGVGALKAFGADRMGMTPEEMTETIDRWRSSNPRIVAAWKSLERAMARCIVHKVTTVDNVCGIRFRWDRGIVWMRLPSGREMAYYGAAYGQSRRSGREGNAISYLGIDQTSRKWVAIETFGGRVFENLVQATARDVLREAMFSLEAKGFDIRATVHDECICTEPIGGKTVEQMCEAMCPDVPWMAGLPLKAAGYEGAYYFKD